MWLAAKRHLCNNPRGTCAVSQDSTFLQIDCSQESACAQVTDPVWRDPSPGPSHDLSSLLAGPDLGFGEAAWLIRRSLSGLLGDPFDWNRPGGLDWPLAWGLSMAVWTDGVAMDQSDPAGDPSRTWEKDSAGGLATAGGALPEEPLAIPSCDLGRFREATVWTEGVATENMDLTSWLATDGVRGLLSGFALLLGAEPCRTSLLGIQVSVSHCLGTSALSGGWTQQ